MISTLKFGRLSEILPRLFVSLFATSVVKQILESFVTKTKCKYRCIYLFKQVIFQKSQEFKRVRICGCVLLVVECNVLLANNKRLTLTL